MCWELIAIFNFLTIRMRVEIFRTEKCKVTFGLEYISFEPRHEKTNILHMQKQRRRSASQYREVDQRLCFSFIDNTIPLLSKSEISNL